MINPKIDIKIQLVLRLYLRQQETWNPWYYRVCNLAASEKSGAVNAST